MNKRELSLVLIVLIGLVLTAFKFEDRSTYDCTQPLFSNQSSCSLINGICVKTHSNAGLVGLWSSFKSLVIEDEKNIVTFKCFPGCSVTIENKTEHSHDVDSAAHPMKNANQ